MLETNIFILDVCVYVATPFGTTALSSLIKNDNRICTHPTLSADQANLKLKTTTEGDHEFVYYFLIIKMNLGKPCRLGGWVLGLTHVLA